MVLLKENDDYTMKKNNIINKKTYMINEKIIVCLFVRICIEKTYVININNIK